METELLSKAQQTWTYKEIGEQAEAIRAAYEAAERSEWTKRWSGAPREQAVFIGSGSSYYQAQVMAATYRSWLGVPASCIPSSDLLLVREQSVASGKPTVVFGISRSGESTEAVLALESAAKLPGWTLAGVTCYGSSRMTRLADCLVLEQGQERSTVMTKSLSGMMMGMQTSIAAASGEPGRLRELARVTEAVGDVAEASERAARSLIAANDFNKTIYLGLGGLLGIAQEGCLKLKEMANVWTESFGTLEFRHGPKSIVDPGSCVVLLLSETAREQELKVAEEMKGYGAFVVLVASEGGSDTAFADLVVEVGLRDVSDEARSVAYLPFLQYYGMYTAVKNGLNPDRPRNLTQVVII